MSTIHLEPVVCASLEGAALYDICILHPSTDLSGKPVHQHRHLYFFLIS
jgi:hypothetical protein